MTNVQMYSVNMLNTQSDCVSPAVVSLHFYVVPNAF